MTIKKEFIIDERSAPTPSCHASTIVQTDDKSFVAAWFGGTGESDSDVRIWVSRLEDGIWTKPQKITGKEDTAHWNPVLFVLPDRRIALFFKVGEVIESWQTFVCFSKDGGRTFTTPREFVPGDHGGRGPVKNKPLRLDNGDIICPASLEKDHWRCYADIIVLGSTAPLGFLIPIPKPEDTGMIQPSFWQDAEHNVHCFMRSRQGHIYRSDSTDLGRSWCEAYPTSLPNNNSGLDLVRIPDGRIFLVCNPVTKGRTPLSLLCSADNGETFEKLADLETEPGEFSYPAVIFADGMLHITYTFLRRFIRHVTVEL